MTLGTSEAAFWAKMRKGFERIKPLGSPIVMNRIESPGTGRGIPDVFLADPEYGACWIELKVVKHRKVNISPPQVHWLTQHATYGIRTRIVALILRDDSRIVRVWNGYGAEAVRLRGLAVGGPVPDINLSDKDAWPMVREALFFDVS